MLSQCFSERERARDASQASQATKVSQLQAQISSLLRQKEALEAETGRLGRQRVDLEVQRAKHSEQVRLVEESNRVERLESAR